MELEIPNHDLPGAVKLPPGGFDSPAHRAIPGERVQCPPSMGRGAAGDSVRDAA
jgi:hypothetical protein